MPYPGNGNTYPICWSLVVLIVDERVLWLTRVQGARSPGAQSEDWRAGVPGKGAGPSGRARAPPGAPSGGRADGV